MENMNPNCRDSAFNFRLQQNNSRDLYSIKELDSQVRRLFKCSWSKISHSTDSLPGSWSGFWKRNTSDTHLHQEKWVIWRLTSSLRTKLYFHCCDFYHFWKKSTKSIFSNIKEFLIELKINEINRHHSVLSVMKKLISLLFVSYCWKTIHALENQISILSFLSSMRLTLTVQLVFLILYWS